MDSFNQLVQLVAHGRVAQVKLPGHFLQAPAVFDETQDKFLVFCTQQREQWQIKPAVYRGATRGALQGFYLQFLTTTGTLYG